MMDDPYAVIAPHYDRAVGADGDDLALYEALARRQGGPVLDVGAGTGRVAVPLAAAGFEVVALDPSPAMVEFGRRRALAAGATVTWMTGRIEDARLDRRFPLVICALDTFLHLTSGEAQAAALRTIAAVLAPEGLAVLDLPTLAAWSDWQPGVRPVELLWSETDAATGAITNHYTTFRADPAAQLRHVTHIFERIDADGRVTRRQVAYPLRFVGRYELVYLLERAGLRARALYGDYELGPLRAESERFVVFVEHAGEGA